MVNGLTRNVRKGGWTHLYPMSLRAWTASRTNSSLSMVESGYMVVPGGFTLTTDDDGE